MPLSLSAETWALIQDFLDRRRVWGLLPESPDRLIISLDAIRQRGEPDAAVLLWPGITRRPQAVRRKALEVMTALLEEAPAAKVMDLIKQIQRMSAYWSLEDCRSWHGSTPDAVRSLAASRPACAGLLILLTGHRSGHVREAAVLGLEGLPLACVLPALRDRLNDWVEPVRRAALRTMRGFLSADHAGALVRSLEAFAGLRHCGRADHQLVLDQIDVVLREPAAQAHVQEGLSSPRPAIRRSCYELLLHRDPPDLWLTWGLEAKDPWIRLHAANVIRTLPAQRSSGDFIERIAISALRPVRQIAVEMFAERGEAERLKGFLLDASPTVREFSRFYLTKILGRFDAKQFYREQLASVADSPTPRILAGLGETGDDSDVPVFMAYVRQRRASTRSAAFRALARLAPAGQTEVFLMALSDSSGRVRQTALAALAARRSALPIARLSGWASTADVVGRRCAVRLLGDYPSTALMPALLPFLVDPSDDVRASAESSFLRSLNSLLNPFLKPDPWRVWVEQHSRSWSSGHQARVRELLGKVRVR